jgi:hypothetical protein
LAARLQYGAGLRVSELVRLRVQDVDLERGTVTAGGGDLPACFDGCARAVVKQPAGCAGGGGLIAGCRLLILEF